MVDRPSRGAARSGNCVLGVEQHRNLATGRIRHDHVALAVAVDVSRSRRSGMTSCDEGLLGGEAGHRGARGGGVEQHRYRHRVAISELIRLTCRNSPSAGRGATASWDRKVKRNFIANLSERF